jgi:FkbM family methyltransferase
VKVAVYTIALNESANAKRWADSALDADYRIVADTGSTDDTVEQLIEAGVTVHRIAVRPWRFDVARNAAMALIPDDVDVCLTLDMDRFLAPGWRAKLEAAWTSGMTALFCQVIFRASADDPMPLRNWSAKNFHHRWGYRFKRAVHEALAFTGPKEVVGSCDDIVIYEVQDHTKTTRSQYLPLMELAHTEDPGDGQICFWLGRDHMWAGRNERAIELLQHYLSLPTSTWADERSEALRYLARLQPDNKMSFLDKARLEAPHRREIWLDLAEEFHANSDWLNLFWACTNGMEKTRRTGSYLDDLHCWGFRLFDLGAIAAWHVNAMNLAVEWGSKALELDADNERLKNNLDFFKRRRDELNADTPPTLPSRERRSDGVVVQNIVKGESISFLVTNPDDEIMKYHYAGSFYETEELDLIMQHYSGEGIFVDIGANVGNHSVYISRFSNCSKLIPFEPNPAAIAILRENLALNECANVDTRFLGVALAAGRKRLGYTAPEPNNLGHTSFYEDEAGDISGIDGDALLLGERVEFIKIDAEGMVFDILSGLEKTIRRWQPTIFLEVRDDKLLRFVEWCARESYQIVDRFRRYDGIQNYILKPLLLATVHTRSRITETEFGEALDAVARNRSSGAACASLAERYRDRDMPVEAAVLFSRSAGLEGDAEDIWYAQWQKAVCLLRSGAGEASAPLALAAFRARPHRGEPLHDLARYYLGKARGDLSMVYAKAGLSLEVPSHDLRGMDRTVYETGLKEAFTIAASYSQDAAEQETGRRICNWLALGRDVPNEVRGLARHNLSWYAEPASALMPSIMFHTLPVSAPDGFKAGNISLVRHGEGFVALVRCVNYDLLESGHFDRHGDASFRQRTVMVHLDERLQMVSSAEVFEPEDMPSALHFDSLGFEDPRLFVWQGKLWCVSCVRQLNEEGRAEMVLARIEASSPANCFLADWRVLASPMPVQWEKNWIPLVVDDELRFIHSLDPVRILDAFGAILREETPEIAADNFKGGTQAIPFDGGWLMLIHEREISGTRRSYFHRIVWLDADYRLVRFSRRFFFQRIASEFAAGLSWHSTDGHLVISFGIDDHEPTLAVVSADDVRAALLTIKQHKEASDMACAATRTAWESMCRTG